MIQNQHEGLKILSFVQTRNVWYAVIQAVESQHKSFLPELIFQLKAAS